MGAAVQGSLLVEQQRLESAIGRVRWAAAALALVLGPLFPVLSIPATIALGIAVAIYNAAVLRASGRAPTLEHHRRISELAFALDLGALSVAMLLFSVDPQWTTFFLGSLVIIMGAFRFGPGGAYTSAAVIGIAYLGISVFRARAFAIPLEPQRVAFHLAVFVLTAFLMDRVLRDALQVRQEREELIRQLQRQMEENERLYADASEAKALRELDRLKDEFLAAVSHELRTPLTVISGSLELLARQKGELGGNARRLVEQAERHVVRLQRNVEDLLDIAQLQEAKIHLQREFVQVSALLAEVAAAHEPLAAAKRQGIRVELEEGIPPVLVDRRRMQQALGNLVLNACRYAPDATDITLRAHKSGGEIRFAVADQGPGVPAAERQRIFDKFYRGERTKEQTSGTGLGLAITRTLVELHGGRVWLEEHGRPGALFVVAIPYEPVPAAAS